LDLQSIIFGNFALSIGALLIAVFVGWIWGADRAIEEIRTGTSSKAGPVPAAARVWAMLVRFVCPLAVIAVLVYIVVTGEYF
jgi:NSS family neurotransmitter:Na+ symporter